MGVAPTRVARGAWGLVTLAALVGTAAVGGLLIAAGDGAWGVSGSLAASVGPLLLAVAGGGAVVLGAVEHPRLRGSWRAYAPRLYPYGSPALQWGIAILAVVSSATVVMALFAEYTGALDGGDSAGVPVPAVSSALYVLASALFWVFAIWIVLLIWMTVRMGRAIELREGRNVYGVVRPDELERAPPRARTPAGPAPPGLRTFLTAAGIAVGLPAMAGIQTVEAGADPASAGAWLVLQVFTPLWAGGLAVSLLWIDGYVRSLEQRYAPRPPRPLPEPGPDGARTPSPQYVP